MLQLYHGRFDLIGNRSAATSSPITRFERPIVLVVFGIFGFVLWVQGMEDRPAEDVVAVRSLTRTVRHDDDAVWTCARPFPEFIASFHHRIREPCLASLPGVTLRHQVQHLVDCRALVGEISVVSVRKDIAVPGSGYSGVSEST